MLDPVSRQELEKSCRKTYKGRPYFTSEEDLQEFLDWIVDIAPKHGNKNLSLPNRDTSAKNIPEAVQVFVRRNRRPSVQLSNSSRSYRSASWQPRLRKVSKIGGSVRSMAVIADSKDLKTEADSPPQPGSETIPAGQMVPGNISQEIQAFEPNVEDPRLQQLDVKIARLSKEAARAWNTASDMAGTPASQPFVKKYDFMNDKVVQLKADRKDFEKLVTEYSVASHHFNTKSTVGFKRRREEISDKKEALKAWYLNEDKSLTDQSKKNDEEEEIEKADIEKLRSTAHEKFIALTEAHN